MKAGVKRGLLLPLWQKNNFPNSFLPGCLDAKLFMDKGVKTGLEEKK